MTAHRKDKGFTLPELLIAMIIGALLISLVSVSLGRMIAVVLRIKESVDSFDRASKVFLLIRRDIFEATRDFSGTLKANPKSSKKITDSSGKDDGVDESGDLKFEVSPEIAEQYPIQSPLQILNHPPSFLEGLSQYSGGPLVWSIHFVRPLQTVSGNKGEYFLNLQSSHQKYLSQAFDAGDVIGVREGRDIQVFQISRVSLPKIFLTQPLAIDVKQGECGLLSNGLWYLGYENKSKSKPRPNAKSKLQETALYRYQNHLNEVMVSGVRAFGISPSNVSDLQTKSLGDSWKVWVDVLEEPNFLPKAAQELRHYVF